MPGLSIHVVDVSRGIIAAGMRVEVHGLGPPRRLLADGRIGAAGLLESPALGEPVPAGVFEALFHVADYYRECAVALPAVPFLGVVAYRFGVADPAQHYHLPFKCTPWGYSCFRGGA